MKKILANNKMPGKRLPKTKAKPRRARRRFRRRRPFTDKVTLPLRTMHKATLRYYEQDIQLDPGVAGIPANYVFSANGLYDPNVSGGGHQPLGFDQLMVMYNHYVCIGAVIKVHLWNEDSTYSQQVVLSAQSTTTGFGSIQNAVEQGRCKWTTLGTANSGADHRVLTMRVNPNKFLGRSKPLSDKDLKGSSTTNPTEECYFMITVAPNNSTVNAGQIRASVTIDYITMFIEPKVLTGS